MDCESQKSHLRMNCESQQKSHVTELWTITKISCQYDSMNYSKNLTSVWIMNHNKNLMSEWIVNHNKNLMSEWIVNHSKNLTSEWIENHNKNLTSEW
jgi:hypothetical protein